MWGVTGSVCNLIPHTYALFERHMEFGPFSYLVFSVFLPPFELNVRIFENYIGPLALQSFKKTSRSFSHTLSQMDISHTAN